MEMLPFLVRFAVWCAGRALSAARGEVTKSWRYAPERELGTPLEADSGGEPGEPAKKLETSAAVVFSAGQPTLGTLHYANTSTGPPGLGWAGPGATRG